MAGLQKFKFRAKKPKNNLKRLEEEKPKGAFAENVKFGDGKSGAGSGCSSGCDC